MSIGALNARSAGEFLRLTMRGSGWDVCGGFDVFYKIPGTDETGALVYDGERLLARKHFLRGPNRFAMSEHWSGHDSASLPARVYCWSNRIAARLVLPSWGEPWIVGSRAYLPDRCRVHEDCRTGPGALGHMCLAERLARESP